ncbi:MAG: ATP-binding protein [Christiangramia sp.]|nr:ATP-binding protein [Christiangramia sp.]
MILFMVMSLHLFFYLKIRNDRKNFWIFLITLFIFLFSLLIILNTLLDSNYYYLELGLLFITQVCFTLIVGFLPLVLHKVLEVHVGRFWKIYTALPFAIFIAVSYAFSNEIFLKLVENNLLPVLLIISSLIGGIVALVKAHKKKRQDMSIVTGSFLAFPILILVGLVAFDIFNISGFLFGALLILCILIVIPSGLSLYQGKKFLRLHKRMDDMVEERTSELELAMENLRRSNQNLKEAQDQLVQQEKLASLGQLTAGIAHEIKNPLNFVTNFSEVCLELIAEAKAELHALAAEAKVAISGNGGESYIFKNVNELLGTVEENLQKINQHGNRADGIVKSMLLHSRGGTGEPQNLRFNDLVREYVNLAYHGMRAGKDPINVDITFDLDEDVDKVSLVSEDFSRAILNLCNNAFDALREKLQSTSFSPELQIQTRQNTDSIQLMVKDNGPGIPEEIRDKILQPFFTTKKGTEGTGLGLSITHDIIKAQGGTLEITSELGSGSVFRIKLPKTAGSKY